MSKEYAQCEVSRVVSIDLREHCLKCLGWQCLGTSSRLLGSLADRSGAHDVLAGHDPLNSPAPGLKGWLAWRYSASGGPHATQGRKSKKPASAESPMAGQMTRWCG